MEVSLGTQEQQSHNKKILKNVCYLKMNPLNAFRDAVMVSSEKQTNKQTTRG